MERKLIKKGDVVNEHTKAGIGSLLVMVPIAGNKTVFWLATIRESIKPKPFLEDRVALVYNLNILDVMKSLAAITLENDTIFNKVREAVAKKAGKFSKSIYAGTTIGWNLECPLTARVTSYLTGATSPVEDGLIGVDLVAMMSFIKLGCRVRIAPVMAPLEQFGAGWLVGGATELTFKESYDDQPGVSAGSTYLA